jgi:hypothetical protein
LSKYARIGHEWLKISFIDHIIQQINVAFQRGNAASILATVSPTSTRTFDDFYSV